MRCETIIERAQTKAQVSRSKPSDKLEGARPPADRKALKLMSRPLDFAEQRRRKIVELVRREGSVRLAELTEPFGVSEPTLRKDLTALEKDGLLRRTHGGAVALETRPITTNNARKAHNIEAKRAIAEVCAGLVEEGQSLYLDSGTTIEVFAEHLRPEAINVLTNAPGVAEAVCETPRIRHTLLGGEYNRVGAALTGAITVETLERFHVDTAFIGVSGIARRGSSRSTSPRVT